MSIQFCIIDPVHGGPKPHMWRNATCAPVTASHRRLANSNARAPVMSPETAFTVTWGLPDRSQKDFVPTTSRCGRSRQPLFGASRHTEEAATKRLSHVVMGLAMDNAQPVGYAGADQRKFLFQHSSGDGKQLARRGGNIVPGISRSPSLHTLRGDDAPHNLKSRAFLSASTYVVPAIVDISSCTNDTEHVNEVSLEELRQSLPLQRIGRTISGSNASQMLA